MTENKYIKGAFSMKTTKKLVAKAAASLLAGMAVLSLASCGSVENKYLKDLESRVAKLEAAVQKQDAASYETVTAGIVDLRSDKKYAELPADDAFAPEAKEKLNALAARIAAANKDAPANDGAEFEVKLSDDGTSVTITNYKGERKNVVVPATIQGLPVVEVRGFSYNDVTSVVISQGVKIIGEKAFYECHYLKSVSLPEGLVTIKDTAFYKCERLETVSFPSTLKYIGYYGFAFSGITAAELPEGFACIGPSAFGACNNLVSVSLPSTLRYYHDVKGDLRIAYGDKLEKISIPDTLTGIYAFEYGLWTGYDDFTFEKFFKGAKIKESVALQQLLKSRSVKWLGYRSTKKEYFECLDFLKEVGVYPNDYNGY